VNGGAFSFDSDVCDFLIDVDVGPGILRNGLVENSGEVLAAENSRESPEAAVTIVLVNTKNPDCIFLFLLLLEQIQPLQVTSTPALVIEDVNI
jgi:hypothetical protein